MVVLVVYGGGAAFIFSCRFAVATALVADFLIFRRRCVGAPVPCCLEPNHSSEKK